MPARTPLAIEMDMELSYHWMPYAEVTQEDMHPLLLDAVEGEGGDIRYASTDLWLSPEAVPMCIDIHIATAGDRLCVMALRNRVVLKPTVHSVAETDGPHWREGTDRDTVMTWYLEYLEKIGWLPADWTSAG